jgi:hypothetical protein
VDYDRAVDTIDNAPVLMNAHNSEPLAYLSVCQGLDGVIHLISSTNHYAFNLAWLKSPTPDAQKMPTARSLPVRRELRHIYDGSKLPSEGRPRWHKLIEGTDEHAAKVEASGSLKVTGNGQRWSNERIDGFGEADAHMGLAVEVAVQVKTDNQQDRGFDFELFVRGGTLTVNHYFISITPTGVYYLYDKEFIELAEGLDNSSAMHTYRLAVRDDTAVQIYRDDKLLGVQAADLVIGWREPARGSFLEWGGGATQTEALVDYIGCDLSGPSRPE